ncbi:Ig domain-containing protein [Thalassospira xiamenensis]|uniref:Dystroglycan-type cadherin-like domain-containing protein n=1 Tax=Thalassospira xiamenensis TaxID=220697 RepID=A0A285TXZ6_9PROT|nr:Ig domain-containing protein [Thalassospira xiamenensis]SOC30925.1 hypothetical protein SAMN05428964_11116 [Thalassospira xiamenensis]
MFSRSLFFAGLVTALLMSVYDSKAVAQTYQFRYYTNSVFMGNTEKGEMGPSILTSSLPVAVVNQQYEAQIEASAGDVGNLNFSSSDKPSWMSLHPVSGTVVELSGIPLTAGTADFSVTVTDSQNRFGSAHYNLSVQHPPCSDVSSMGDLCEDGLIYVGTYASDGGSFKYFLTQDNLAPMVWYSYADSTRYGALAAAIGEPT